MANYMDRIQALRKAYLATRVDMDVYNAASGDLPTEPDETTQRAA